MPVIYDHEMGQQWLDPRTVVSSPMILAAILQPLPSERMEAHEVSTVVNSPENDSPACIQPLSPGESLKRQLPLL
jgi:putative SOS response-associated peptidase YedK